MNFPPRCLLPLAAALLLAGCDSPERTLNTTRKQLSEFRASPDDAKLAAVNQSLEKLDRQIQELGKKDPAAAAALSREAVLLHGDLQAAKLARTLNDAKNAIQGFGEAAKSFGKSFTETLSSVQKEATNQPAPADNH